MLNFINNSEKLSSREVGYWKKVFNSNLMFASEVEFESDDSSFRVSNVQRDLDTDGSIYSYGNGIESVKSDGSLRNGAEVLTPPRRLYSMLQMVSGYKSLVDELYAYSPIIKARAGWHNHVSLMNIDGVKAQEMPVPSVILKNVITICKLYYPSLAWFTSTLPDSEGAYTRYDEFCRQDKLQTVDSRGTIDSMINHFDNTRYNCLNFRRLELGSIGVNRFHIEFRFPDCSLFPVQMACFNILTKALILKAIELSRYGVICSDLSDESEMLYEYRNSFNYDSDYDDYYNSDMFITEPDSDDRISAMIEDKYIERIKRMGSELIYLLEDEIKKIDSDSFDFIDDLMSEPICMKFRKLDTNIISDINEMYEENIDALYEEEDQSLEEITKIISLGLIKNASNKELWKERLIDLVSCKEDVDFILKKINKIRALDYSKELGYYFK